MGNCCLGSASLLSLQVVCIADDVAAWQSHGQANITMSLYTTEFENAWARQLTRKIRGMANPAMEILRVIEWVAWV